MLMLDLDVHMATISSFFSTNVVDISHKQVNFLFVHGLVKYVAIAGHKVFKCLYLIWMYIWQLNNHTKVNLQLFEITI